MKSFLVALTFIFSFSAQASKPALTNIELKWKATTDMSDFAEINLDKISHQKIKVAPLKDVRKGPHNRVGENHEDEKQIKPVETTSNVSGYVTENFKEVLRKAGLAVVDSGEEYTLSGEIEEYFVKETNTYKGDLRLRLKLQKGGKVVWQGVALGTNSRFGRSYKLDNYLESFSDLIIDASLNLLKKEEFRKAL